MRPDGLDGPGAGSVGASTGHDRHAIRGFRTGAGRAIVMA
jgi:hypothetical protein